MTSLMRRYIIEHPTRGVLKEISYTDSGTQLGRFSPTASRVEGMIFYSLVGAQNARDKIRPHKLREQCEIRQEPTDAEVTRTLQYGDAWKVVA